MLLENEKKELYAILKESTDWSDRRMRDLARQAIYEEDQVAQDKVFKNLSMYFNNQLISISRLINEFNCTEVEVEKKLDFLISNKDNFEKIQKGSKNKDLSRFLNYIDIIEVSWKAGIKKGRYNKKVSEDIFYILYNTILSHMLFWALFILSTPMGLATTGGRLVGIIMRLVDSLLSMAKKLQNKTNQTKDNKKLISSNEAVGTILLSASATILLITQIVPLLREALYFLYYSGISIGDSMKGVSDAIEYNILELEKNNPNKSPEKLESIAKKQSAIAKRFRKIGDKLNNLAEPAMKKAKISAKKDSDEKLKMETIEQINNLDSDEIMITF